MKKIFKYMLAAAAVLTAASCAQELVNPQADPELVPMTLTVDGDVTKTAVGEDGKTINWCENDQIAVFDGTAKRQFTATAIDGKKATFVGMVADGAKSLYAVYPYSAAVDCANGVISATLATQQQLAGNNVADGAILAVGKVNADASVQFKNAVGFLRVDVSYDDVTEVIVSGQNLAGTATFNEVGVLDKVAEGTSSVTLKPAGEKFAAGSYYVALLPGTTPANAFSITLVRAQNGLTMVAPNEVAVPRNSGFFVEDTQLTETAIIKDAASLQSFLTEAADYEEGQLATVIRDIDLTGVTITSATDFAGTFNGNGYSLKNWTSSTPLFANVAATGKVSNLVIAENCTLSFPQTCGHFGFVAKINAGSLSGIVNYADVAVPAIASVEGTNDVGAICGKSTGPISNCSNYGDFTYTGAASAKNVCYGGVVGDINGATAIVSNSYNMGNMSFTLNAIPNASVYINGVVGWLGNNAKILDCVNYGDVTVKTPGSTQMVTACGIVTYAGGEVSGCYNYGDMTYLAESAEGLADGGVQRTGVCGIAAYMGWAGKTVTDNHNEGEVYFRAGYSRGFGACGSAPRYSVNVAGLFGHMFNCGVKDCTNSGKVTFILADLDNASAQYTTSARPSCGGVVASTYGDITNCENSGDIDYILTTDLPMAGVARPALENQMVAQVGGVAGGDYNSATSSKNQDTGQTITTTLQTTTNIRDCKNSGNINYICDTYKSNNSLGGIVGWPHKEGTAGKSVSGCENTGTIAIEGVSLTRAGGITGGCMTVANCVNRGKVYLKSGQATCTLGGISGVAAGSQPITGCENYGEIVSEVKLAGAQGGSSSSIGGIVGASFNQAVTLTGCVLDCDIKAPAGSTAFVLVGVVGSNKTATTKNVFGTAESPNVIKGGSLTLGTTTTAVTASNYNTLALPWDTNKTVSDNGLKNPNISYVVNFQN